MELQGSGARPAPKGLRHVARTGPQEFWHTPFSPTVRRGPLGFYKSQFIYLPGPSALPGIYRFLSDRVSGGKCKWNVNREAIASPVSPAAAEPKLFGSFPGAQWCNGALQKGRQGRGQRGNRPAESPELGFAAGRFLSVPRVGLPEPPPRPGSARLVLDLAPVGNF